MMNSLEDLAGETAATAQYAERLLKSDREPLV